MPIALRLGTKAPRPSFPHSLIPERAGSRLALHPDTLRLLSCFLHHFKIEHVVIETLFSSKLEGAVWKIAAPVANMENRGSNLVPIALAQTARIKTFSLDKNFLNIPGTE
jgi:hypothetical protein